MGTIRTILAIIVVFAHSYGMISFGGVVAVQSFYIISGFLISYIIVEKKAYPNLLDFYVNRYLRLFPVYIVVASITLLVYFIYQYLDFFKVYATGDSRLIAYLILTNLFIFLQDIAMFLSTVQGHLSFATNFRESDVPIFAGLLVPQAWSLGVELSFYIIAPFVLPRRWAIFILLFLSLCVRAWLIHLGLAFKDPWGYRFFPSELAFFLIGALSHQILLKYAINAEKKTNGAASTVVTIAIIFLISIFSLIDVNRFFKAFLFLGIFALSIPFIFVFQSKFKLDQKMGELSYPIYISHRVIIFMISDILSLKFGLNNLSIALICLLLTLIVSVALVRWIVMPVEVLRSKRKARAVHTTVPSFPA
jgi:peptidoglycan/LPS O-acetylase OafA/YrhL